MRLVIFFLTLTSLAHFGFSPDSLPYAQPQSCPTIYVTCPDTYELNKPMTLRPTIVGIAPNIKLVYEWQVSASERSIVRVRTRLQSGGHEIIGGSFNTATVKLKVFPRLNAAIKASCTINLSAPSLSRWFDQYSNLPFRDEKARLQ